jgi:succinyl-diaminopimelate desuccinylase
MSNTLELAKELIAIASLTPNDNGCQKIISRRLKKLDFELENHHFGDVNNLWARLGKNDPLFVFAGHTDVVPTGPLDQWTHDPFTPTVVDGTLYGRGAADMKSSIAAMICACESHFFQSSSTLKGSVAFLITSDEEGPAIDGTIRVIDILEQRNEKIKWCLVGEPTSTQTVGDVIKNGRRGSLIGKLTIHGQQGHIAYPHLADNPIHSFAPALNDLINEQWCQGNEFFPPTTFQISNINAGTGAPNVIPGDLDVEFNLRFSTELSQIPIEKRIEKILGRHNLNYTLDWTLSGNPFITKSGELITATQNAIRTTCKIETELSTAGGTSDGRFIAPTGAQVIELGPVNESIHKIDEHINIGELDKLTEIYSHILKELLT